MKSLLIHWFQRAFIITEPATHRYLQRRDPQQYTAASTFGPEEATVGVVRAAASGVYHSGNDPLERKQQRRRRSWQADSP